MVGERIPDPVPVAERVRALPNTVALALALGIFVAAALVGTVPYDATGADGPVACSSPLFELTVPAPDGPVPVEEACQAEARTRMLLPIIGVGVAVVGGFTSRQIRRRRYDPRRYEVEELTG